MQVKLVKNNNSYDLYSKYDKDLIQIIKSFEGSKFNRLTKSWTINAEFIDQLMNKLKEKSFEPEICEEADEIAKTSPDQVTIAIEQNSFKVQLPIPKSLYANFYSTKKLNITKEFWQISDTYFMDFYQFCSKSKFVLNII